MSNRKYEIAEKETMGIFDPHELDITGLSNSTPTSISRNVVEEPIDKIQSWKQVISMCTSIVALERFKVRVEEINDEGLTEAYNEKLNILTNQ